MFQKRLIFFVSLLLLPLSLLAQQDARKMKIDATKPIRIDYESPSWNKNKDEIELAAILIRDANSGQTAKVELKETGTNTGIFEGFYQLSFAEANVATEITPELYVAPLKMLQSTEQLKKMEMLIKDGTLLRKPYFLRVEGGKQLITVYDSKDQALNAYKTFMQPILQKQALEAQRLAEKEAEIKRLAEMAAKAKSERERLEAEERRKKEELKRKQAEMTAAEIARRKKLALDHAFQGVEDFKKENFKSAEENFTKATELDPDNNKFYYQYGVVLFRNEKYNKSLTVLDLAKDPAVNQTELEYYKGLNYYKMRDSNSAYKEFAKVKDKDDPKLSASAAFYMGLIDFEKERYDEAKSQFEYVLDKSSDPKIDEQAEAYIEQIANIKMFLVRKAKRWTLNLSGGMQYDSNILLQTSGSTTDLAGWRASYSAGLEYRILFEEKYEWSAALNYSDMYSMDNKFQAAANFQNTDPLMVTLYLPYRLKGTYFGKPAQLTFSPGYETMSMNADGSGARENIMNSAVLKNEATLVMGDDWFSTYSLELRSDTSLLTSSAEEDLTATKVTLNTSNIFFKNKKKTESVTYDAGLALNQAKGSNQRYQRLDLAGTYAAPWKWETSWNGKLGLGYATYPNHSSSRADTIITLSTGLAKPFTETLNGLLNLTYTNNGSNVDSSKYDKYILMGVFSWSTNF